MDFESTIPADIRHNDDLGEEGPGGGTGEVPPPSPLECPVLRRGATTQFRRSAPETVFRCTITVDVDNPPAEQDETNDNDNDNEDNEKTTVVKARMVTTRADIWSLGPLLWGALFTGPAFGSAGRNRVRRLEQRIGPFFRRLHAAKEDEDPGGWMFVALSQLSALRTGVNALNQVKNRRANQIIFIGQN